MPNKRIIENELIDRNSLDLSTWATVLVDNLKVEDQEVFIRRKKAVEMYLSNIPHKEITKETGIKRSELSTFIRRCIQEDENGIIWGYRALIPHKRISTYRRKQIKKPSLNNSNVVNTGLFLLLLETYPSIKDTIHTLFLRRKNRSASDPVIRIKDLHKRFIEACRGVGLKPPHDYPFNTIELGRKSLIKYVKKLEARNLEKATVRYGEKATQLVRTTGIGEQNSPMIKRPFQRVQFDGHRIDVCMSMIIRTPEGDEISTIIDRIWLLAIIDVATRIILGYHITFNKECCAGDVLQCIKKAIVPWTPKTLSIPSLKYPENGGFASGIIPETEWGLWDELCYDNAKANLSAIVKDRLTKIVGCTINAGAVGSPIQRGIIERFFGILEENGFHRLPSTTGSNPSDPRRQSPEKKAIKYSISAEQIEELTEILIAEYNGTPHQGVNFLTPLEAMQQRVVSFPVRQMPAEQRNEVTFLSLQAQRTIKGNVQNGKRPYVQYENVTYRNEILSRSPELIGKKLDLLVNVDDLRIIRAYLPDGSELGKLQATGKWGITPHSLQIRKEIFRLRSRKLLHFTSTEDPILIYQKFLEIGSQTRKKARNKLQELKRIQQRNQGSLDSTDSNTIANDSHELEATRMVKQNKVTSSTNEQQQTVRKLRKTISY